MASQQRLPPRRRAGRRSVAAGRCRRGQHDGVAPRRAARRRHGPPAPAAPFQPLDGRREPDVHPAAPQRRGQRVDQRGHTAARAPRRAAVRPGRAVGHLGPQRAHQAAPALGGGQERREGRRRRTCRRPSRRGSRRCRGSTSMSTTRWPSLRATSGPMARSPMGPRTSGRGSTASRASPSVAPQAERCPSGPWARTGSGCPGPGLRAAGAGGRGPTPRHRGAPTGTSASAEPDLAGTGRPPRAGGRGSRRGPGRRRGRRRPRSAAGRRAGPTPRARRPCGRVRAAAAPPVSSQAAASPLMPPPTTTTAAARPRRSAHVASVARPTITSARTSMNAGSSLSEAVRAKASPPAAATAASLDVEVVEHLEVVGHEADRADARRRRPRPPRRQPAHDVADVGAEPGLGGPSRALPRHHASRVEAGRGRHEPGRLGQLLGVGVAGLADALGQRVRGEDDRGAGPAHRREGVGARGRPGAPPEPARRTTAPTGTNGVPPEGGRGARRGTPPSPWTTRGGSGPGR